jgi:hypothetical protein
MAQSTKSDNKLMAQERRRTRLAAELRANLGKRKQQARGRAPEASGDAPASDTEGGDELPGGPTAPRRRPEEPA